MSNDADKTTIEEIDCLEAIDSLYAYLDGELDDPGTIAQFEAHLSHCRSCYSRTEMEKALNARMEAYGGEVAPESLRNRLRNLIDKL
ncbi:MAG: anti-sigma factor family protein [Thiogranum sp.]